MIEQEASDALVCGCAAGRLQMGSNGTVTVTHTKPVSGLNFLFHTKRVRGSDGTPSRIFKIPASESVAQAA